jgi:bacterioferritin-associated ferredoxin
MIVCLCKGVSSHTILSEARRGNCTVAGIAKACGAGTGCGACQHQIRDLVRGHGSGMRAHDDVAPRGR